MSLSSESLSISIQSIICSIEVAKCGLNGINPLEDIVEPVKKAWDAIRPNSNTTDE